MEGLINFSFLNAIYYGNSVRQYLIFLLVFLIVVLISRIVYYLLRYPLGRFVERTKNLTDDQILEIIKWPFVFFIIIIGLKISFDFLYLPDYFRDYVDSVILTLVILNIIWLGLKFFDLLVIWYLYPLIKSSPNRLDDQLVSLIQRFIKIIVVVLGLFFALENFGINARSLLTGLGIGGLAVALAAKDTLSNLFGSLAVLSDKPFKVGDIVKFKNYEGVVKEVGLRSSRIITFDTTEIVIPNSLLANEIIENISKRRAVKKEIILHFDKGTKWKKLEIAKKVVDNILLNEEGVLDEYHTALVSFPLSGPEMKVVYWVKYNGDYEKYLEIRHRLHSKIKQALEDGKIELAG
ncbi:MAG: mechanosensitive ion channel [Patescibacteria group bacterium]|nr:mechanosensitive ion channel [Patescibacteria group bacterium]MDD5490456.1 mechanosensitive ion channel [Patescibacteria group bacterium]